MAETIGYLVLSIHANSFLKPALLLTALGPLFYMLLFAMTIDTPLSRFMNTIFTCLCAIGFVTILASLSSSWFYQTKAIETCSKDPSCDYALANKAARDIINLGMPITEQK